MLSAVLLAMSALAAPAAADPAARMVAAINEERARDSLPPLRNAPELTRSAGAFAHYLLRNDSLAHRPSVSVSRAYPHCGEALAMHFSLAAQVRPTLRSWLGSPSHRGLVLTNSMSLVGIGHARGRSGGRSKTVWVLQVARRRAR